MKYMKNNLTVFEPKHPFSDRNKTDTIPLSQTTRLDIECLNWYLKYGLPLGIFSTQKLNRKITFSCKLSLQFLNRCSEFFSEKLIYNTFQICGEKTKSVVFRMKWIVLPYSELYSEEIKCIKGKFYPYSYVQQHWLTNSIRKCVCIIFNFFHHSCHFSATCAFFLSLYFLYYVKFEKFTKIWY